MNERRLFNFSNKSLKYILVAVAASLITLFFCQSQQEDSKLLEVKALLGQYFVGEVDEKAMEDAAAAAMVDSLGDRWSYYIPADEYEAYQEQMNNAYVGIGVTIAAQEEEQGFLIQQVQPGGGAEKAGVLPGDILTHVEGKTVKEIGVNGIRNQIRGAEGTTVNLTFLRNGESVTYAVMRTTIQVEVAKYQMLDNGIGLIRIVNFDKRCAEETLKAVDTLVEQGATALIFDVRFNPGGYKEELVKILDRLLPEGVLFRSISPDDKETVDQSDEACLELPMAVLVNGESYSAAEFFAAALREYDWAVVVGEPTVGKGYFQNTFQLSDGSAVGLSVGKYLTPKGVSLAEEGGLVPDVTVTVDEALAAQIYADQLPVEEDPQLQAAIQALQKAQ